MNRRQYLSGLAGSTALVAGCLDDSSGTATQLVELSGVNYTTESRILFVEVCTDGEPQYTESVELTGTPEGEDRFTAAAFDGYPTTGGAHIIHSWHDEQTREESTTFDFTNIDHECVTVQIEIGASPHRDEIGSDIRFTKSLGCPDDE